MRLDKAVIKMADQTIHVTDFEVVGDKFVQLGSSAVDCKFHLTVTADGMRFLKCWFRQVKKERKIILQNKRRRRRGRSKTKRG